MAAPKPKGVGHPRGERSFGQIVIDDLKHTRFDRSLVRELQDLYRFYLDDETRTRLSGMSRIKRAFWLLGWLLKSLYLKLSRGRRLSLLLALLFAALGRQAWQTGTGVSGTFDFRLWGFVLLLLIFMLELKDKLLARDEIEVARQVQLSLLPRRHPSIEGWTIWGTSRPANDVGGDLVDYLHPDGENLGIALGDVAGKGMGAALLSAKLQATLRALATECSSLDDLAARLNAILYRDGLENRYATMFYCEIGPRSGMLRYVNAGHNPPLLLRADGSTTLGPSSLPLGMLPSAAYREEAVELRSGELLLIYSDGLTEATDADGKEFGEGRLRKVVESCRDRSPREIAEAILEEVGAFLGEERPHDDLSLTILQRT